MEIIGGKETGEGGRERGAGAPEALQAVAYCNPTPKKTRDSWGTLGDKLQERGRGRRRGRGGEEER